MPRYGDLDALEKKLFPMGMVDDGRYALPAKSVKVAIDRLPTADVAPIGEVERLRECVYDLYVMLDKIIESAKRHDLTMLRPFRGASGCDAYQGLPPICRSVDALFDKYVETIHGAANYVELKKKYTEGE